MKSTKVMGLIAVLVLGATASARAATQSPTQTPTTPTQAAPVALCTDCHEAQAKSFSANPHARALKKAVAAAPGTNVACETCHGDGTAHIESTGATPPPLARRGRLGAETCLTCHREDRAQRSYRTGIHAVSETVNCLTCHSIHSSNAKSARLLVKEESLLCATCHQTQAASLRNKPVKHRLGRGGMECTSCHDPHGRAGRDSLKLTRADELPCASCHSEKRGPFVFEHVSGVAGDCMSCHEPHGSSNPKQLVRSRVDQLCLECHSALSPVILGSQPPSIHDVFSPRYRNCTTCHVAIHGSHRSPKLLK
jgi:DmsE family decaheme c-type cytochrome